MNDWISWSASMHFCSISNVQLLQPCLGPGHAHGHTDMLVHRLGRRPFHPIRQREPQIHRQEECFTKAGHRQRGGSFPLSCLSSLLETDREKTWWMFPLHCQGPRPLAMPFELVLFVPQTFLPRVHLAVPWVVLALPQIQCGRGCSSGNAGSLVPAFSDSSLSSSTAPPRSLVGCGVDEHGKGWAWEL